MTAKEHTFKWLDKVYAIIWLFDTRIDPLYAENHDYGVCCLKGLKVMKRVRSCVFRRC